MCFEFQKYKIILKDKHDCGIIHYFEQIVSLNVVLTHYYFHLFMVLIMLTIKLLLLLCSHIKKQYNKLFFISINIDLFRNSIDLRNFLNSILCS